MKRTNYKVFFVLLGVYFATQIPFLTSVAKVWTDEPWYANVAYNFAQGNGLVDTLAREGTAWVAFLYPLILGCFFKVFGTSVWVGRFVSVMAGAVALAGLIQIQRLWKIKPAVVLLTGLLFIFSNVYYIVFRTIRPEAWCVAFAVWGFFFLARGADRNRNIDFGLSALLSSCAVMSHPNGVLYALLYGLFVFGFSCSRRSFIPVVGFATVGLVCALGWVFYYTVIGGADLTAFFAEASNTRTVIGKASVLTAFLSAIKTFAATYSLGAKRAYIFIFECGVMVAGLFFARQNRKLFFTALAGLLFFMLSLLAFQPFATRHFSEVLFFGLLGTGLLFQQVYARKPLLLSLFLLTSAYGLNNILGDVYLVFRDHKNTPFDQLSLQISQQIPKESKVLSLMPFWFGLKTTAFYNESTRWEAKGYESLDAFLKTGGADYVVISPYLLDGRTGTSGRKERAAETENIKGYCQKVLDFSEQHGRLITELSSDGYGKISIWEIKK
jgi:hypothetical protein